MTDSQGPRCETCEFGLFEPGHDRGLCRRFPPQVLAWFDPKPANPAEPVVLRAQFPMMVRAGWCGEHKSAVAVPENPGPVRQPAPTFRKDANRWL